MSLLPDSDRVLLGPEQLRQHLPGGPRAGAQPRVHGPHEVAVQPRDVVPPALLRRLHPPGRQVPVQVGADEGVPPLVVAGGGRLRVVGAQGVQVYRGSSSQIFSNTIQNNGSHGVFVDRNSQAEIAACTITGNAGDGIRGMRNAGIECAGTQFARVFQRFFGSKCQKINRPDSRKGDDQCQPVNAPK